MHELEKKINKRLVSIVIGGGLFRTKKKSKRELLRRFASFLALGMEELKKRLYK